jgi:hypothetical protein
MGGARDAKAVMAAKQVTCSRSSTVLHSVVIHTFSLMPLIRRLCMCTGYEKHRQV